MDRLLKDLETEVPSAQDAALATEASREISKAPEGELQVKLQNGAVLTLPKAAQRLLHHLLTEMSQGNAVTLMPIHAELTTQEAAAYLNVSRPHLVKLLESGKLPFGKVGSHRRVRADDLIAYKKRRDEESEKAMVELAAEAQELGLGY
jgi:excisionase family DNA binding protein